MSIALVVVLFTGLLVLLVAWQFSGLVREAARSHVHTAQLPDTLNANRHV
jgi:hypothetical protein